MAYGYRHPGAGDDQHKVRFPAKTLPDTTILVVPIRNNLSPVTRACLENFGKEAVVYRWLDPTDNDSMQHGMWEAIKEHWTGEKTLIFIDHDMIFSWESLRDFYNCASDWCASPYTSLNYQVDAPLGFCKFSRKVQQVVSTDLIDEEMQACKGCRGEWWGVEWHLFVNVQLQMGNNLDICTHNHVLNDHAMFGLKDDNKFLETDVHTPEGRFALTTALREKLGWKLEKEPTSFEEVMDWNDFEALRKRIDEIPEDDMERFERGVVNGLGVMKPVESDDDAHNLPKSELLKRLSSDS